MEPKNDGRCANFWGIPAYPSQEQFQYQIPLCAQKM